MDASDSEDAGAPDAGLEDAGDPDAGDPDAGPEDAGDPDAGPEDAGPPDAGDEDAGPADAGEEPPPPPLGRAVFQDLDGNIALLDEDGAGYELLVDVAAIGEYEARGPSWIADGDRVAFVSGDYAWIAEADGSGVFALELPITPTSRYQGYADSVRVSPDEKYASVVALDYNTDRSSTFILEVTAPSPYRRLVTTDEPFFFPSDGEHVVYTRVISSSTLSNDVRLRHIETNVVSSIAEGRVLALSRNDVMLLQRAYRDEDGYVREARLFLRPIAGIVEDERQVTDDNEIYAERDPRFSPDGSEIVVSGFELSPEGDVLRRYLVWVIDVDTLERTAVYDLEIEDPDALWDLALPRCVRWIPHRRALAWLTFEPEAMLWVAEVGAEPVLVGEVPMYDCPEWRAPREEP